MLCMPQQYNFDTEYWSRLQYCGPLDTSSITGGPIAIGEVPVLEENQDDQ